MNTPFENENRSRRLVLLGPQPEYRSLQQAVQRVGEKGSLAVITAGWQEDEGQDSELDTQLSNQLVDLKLFERSDELFKKDPELIQLLRDRQDELRHLRDAYRIRLDYALTAARRMIVRDDPLIELEPETESAIEMVRQLDRQYFLRTSQICDEYEQRMQVPERPLVVEHRQEISKLLDKASGILISGGHSAIILNRLRLFGILETHLDLPIIAWSGGAMALADQIVFFHDSPPQGPGNAEVLRAGMGVYDQFLPLPDARTRLKLDDACRVELFSRRFNYYQCVILDEQSILDRTDENWWISPETEVLTAEGALAKA